MCNNTVELLKTIIDLCRCDKEKIMAVTDALKEARHMAASPEVHDDTSGEKEFSHPVPNGHDPVTPAPQHAATGGMQEPSPLNDAGAAEAAALQLAELKSRLSSLEKAKSLLEQESIRLKKENSELSQQVNGLQNADREVREEIRSLRGSKEELTAKLNSANNSAKEAARGYENRIRELESSLKDQKNRYDKDVYNCKAEIRNVRDERDAIRAKYDRCSGIISSIPDIDAISSLAEFIRALPESVRGDDALKSLDLGNITNLLVQCGHISRLSTAWEVIRKKTIESGSCHPDLTKLMIRLMDFYNRANPGMQFQAVIPETGIPFSAENHSRPNGKTVSSVRKVLFPGLKNSGNKVLSRPVVE